MVLTNNQRQVYVIQLIGVESGPLSGQDDVSLAQQGRGANDGTPLSGRFDETRSTSHVRLDGDVSQILHS
jgi:hypothetical protein